MPKLFVQLKKNLHTLEKHYKDMQDVEFTIGKQKTLDATDSIWKKNCSSLS